jgi:ribosomal protein RSM22 (predicted rRNA methylase)
MSDPANGLAARWPALRAAFRGRIDETPLTREERERVVRGVQRLSEGLTRERALVGGRYLDDPELLGAYLLFYWPISYAQARAVLGELPAPLGRVLDLGAGPLPMSWAARDAGADEVLALDRVERALQLGSSLGEGARTAVWDPERGDALPQGTFDTVLMGHVVNELFLGPRALERRLALVHRVLGVLAPGGNLVVIEPALRETSRALLQIRDALVDAGAVVRAPCLMHVPCPALARVDDWCHAERRWSPPAELAAIAEAARLHKERIKFSYLVVAPGGARPVDDTRRFRIVSDALGSKGKRAQRGCGPRGLHTLVRRDRDADTLGLFDELERGDVIEAEGLVEKGDGLRIEPTSKLTRIARAGEPVSS